MSLVSLIEDTRKAISDDASASAQAAFTAQGTLVGVTEVDIETGAHTFKVDEPPALGGADAAANPVQYALVLLGSCQAITYRFWAAQGSASSWTRSPCGSRATWICAGSSGSTTPYDPVSPPSGSR